MIKKMTKTTIETRQLFRPHRGSLNKAMSEVFEFKDLDDLISYIQEQLIPFVPKEEITKNTVKIKGYVLDKRIGWHTYIVTLEGYGVLGFTSCMIE